MKGRKPKPNVIKIAEGNPGKRKIKKEPQPTTKTKPTPPSHLSAAAKREWTRISKELWSMGLLTQVDRAALAAYCTVYARWAEAEKKAQQGGLIVESQKGNDIQNPYVGIANRAMDQMYKYLTEFGMSPVSRTRLATNDGEDDLLDAFLKRKEANKRA